MAWCKHHWCRTRWCKVARTECADITLVDLKDRGVKLQIARRDDQTIAPGETKRVFIGRRDLVDITGTADGEVTLNGHPATPVENVAEQRYPW